MHIVAILVIRHSSMCMYVLYTVCTYSTYIIYSSRLYWQK